MAKGQMKSGKEGKKPKADKAQSKAGGSAYKQSQIKTSPNTNPFGKKA